MIAEGERLADDLSPIVARLFASEPVAERYPAFLQILADDAGRMWFRLPARIDELAALSPRMAFRAVDSGSSRWLVQAEDGRARWNLAFPTGFHPMVLKDDVATGILWMDGGAAVQSYRFTLPSS